MRHPVVITSLEEDFRKIGLLKESPERTMGSGDHSSDSEVAADQEAPETVNLESEEDDFDPLDEAIAFSEAFDEEWEALGSMREVALDEDDMAEMDDWAEEAVELPGGILDGLEEEDEDDEYDSEGTMESLSASMLRIEALMESMDENSAEAAVPAFSNVALIAEHLALFFDSVSGGRTELEEAAGHFAEMAQEAAGIVELLQTEDEGDINFDLVHSTFLENMNSLLNGLEVYSEMVEEEEDEDEGKDGDDA